MLSVTAPITTFSGSFRRLSSAAECLVLVLRLALVSSSSTLVSYCGAYSPGSRLRMKTFAGLDRSAYCSLF